MSPQQNMENGNWPIPQRNMANWNQPTVSPGQPQIPQWLQNLLVAYSQPATNPQIVQTPQYPAQPQVQQPQPQQNQPPAPTLIGRHVNNLSEIKPIEIPMDGTATYFPTFDGSAIYLRYWDQDGQIKGQRYVPEVSTNEIAAMESQKPSFPTIQEINDTITPKIDSLGTRLAAIESILAGVQVSAPQPPRSNLKPKKEESTNG